MQGTAKPKGLAKIWREVKRPFARRMKAFEKVGELRTVKREVDTYFGASSEISKHVGTALRFHQWKSLVGGEITKLLRVQRPAHADTFGVFALHVGVDLDKEIQSTNEALILDGIKLPHPHNEADRKLMLEYELGDVVLPSYLRGKFESFDRYCSIVENHLNDFNEGPYEWGEVCLKEGDIVFDCGANMGLFSAVASRYGCATWQMN